MDKMKKYFKYFMIFFIGYFVVNITSFYIVKSTYISKTCKINFTEPKVEIIESKATITDGYVNGKITNNTQKNIANKVLILEFYSPRNVKMGTKLVEIQKLPPNETIAFTKKYNFDNVNNVVISYKDKAEIQYNKEYYESDDLSLNDTDRGLILIGILFFLFQCI